MDLRFQKNKFKKFLVILRKVKRKVQSLSAEGKELTELVFS